MMYGPTQRGREISTAEVDPNCPSGEIRTVCASSAVGDSFNDVSGIKPDRGEGGSWSMGRPTEPGKCLNLDDALNRQRFLWKA